LAFLPEIIGIGKIYYSIKPATYFFDATNPNHSISTFSDWKSQDLTGAANLI
jgi:hypothetical protein